MLIANEHVATERLEQMALDQGLFGDEARVTTPENAEAFQLQQEDKRTIIRTVVAVTWRWVENGGARAGSEVENVVFTDRARRRGTKNSAGGQEALQAGRTGLVAPWLVDADEGLCGRVFAEDACHASDVLHITVTENDAGEMCCPGLLKHWLHGADEAAVPAGIEQPVGIPRPQVLGSFSKRQGEDGKFDGGPRR